ncbi:hypothetical protein I4P06_17170 [Enterobacter asburiae]|nr:hypothetical protein [Enterobacter asburiae]
MERNMDESRKAFESWCKTVMTDDADFCMEWGDYSNLNVRLRWEAWTASRAAIEIELPMPKYTWRSDDYSQGFDKGLAEQRKNDTDAIRAAGIKVKE